MREQVKLEPLTDHGVIAFYSRAEQSAAAISLVGVLEGMGWKVDHVSPDEYSGWTKCVLRHAEPLTALASRAVSA